MAEPSLDPADARQLDRVVGSVRDVLSGDLLGLYLTGSAVRGGLKPDSDLDLLAVSRRATSTDERRGLIRSLLALSGRHAVSVPARSIELSIAVESEVRPWCYPPPLDLQYGDWWRAELERGLEPWDDPNPDLAVLLSTVRDHGRPLIGPPPAELLDPVPAADLRRAVVAGVPALLADLADDTQNVLLTLARIWVTLATGDIWEKHAAATWAGDRLPPEAQSVLATARAAYLGEAPDAWTDAARARRTADAIVEAIRRLADSTVSA